MLTRVSKLFGKIVSPKRGGGFSQVGIWYNTGMKRSGSKTSGKLALCVKIAAFLGVAFACYACSTQATVSGYEDSTVVLTNSYSQVRYDGCFWNDRLWEDDWTEKKSIRHTLKLVRVRIVPWQSLAAVATLGVWVPVYLEWEINGDKR